MARIRTIKPEFFTHPEVVACSIPARLLLVSLLTQADDGGRLYDQPKKILSNAFGEGDRVKATLLEELSHRGRICRYDSDGRACMHVLNFNRHQTISHPKPSVIPPCPIHARSGTSPGAVPDDSRGEQGTGNGTGNREVPATQGAVAPPRRKIDPPKAEVNGHRPDQVMFSVVAEVCGWPVGGITPDARGRINSAAKQLRDAGATEEEVRLFGVLYEQHYGPDVDLTPQAITGNWGAFKGGKLFEAARRRR